MRAWLALAVLAGCGRFGFPDGHAAADATEETGRDSEVGNDDLGDGNTCTEPFGDEQEVVTGLPAPQSPTVTLDGLDLFVDYAGDLYVLTRASRSETFSLASLVVTPNSLTDQDIAPSISDDGLTVYFTSFRQGGAWVMQASRASRTAPWDTEFDTNARGSSDASSDQQTIYTLDYQSPMRMLTRTSRTDPFGSGIDLPFTFEPGTDYSAPSISSDGLDFYFSTRRGGEVDVRVSRRASLADPFSASESLGIAGSDPDISPDGHYLYITYVDPQDGSVETHVLSRCVN